VVDYSSFSSNLSKLSHYSHYEENEITGLEYQKEQFILTRHS